MKFLCVLVLLVGYLYSGRCIHFDEYATPDLSFLDCKQIARYSERPIGEDELIESDCWGTFRCIGEKANLTECYPTKIFDYKTRTCIMPTPAGGRCNKIAMCYNKADGQYRYQDPPHATKVYTCTNKQMTRFFSCVGPMDDQPDDPLCRPDLG